MNFLVHHSELRDLCDKVAAGERVSERAAGLRKRVAYVGVKRVAGERDLAPVVDGRARLEAVRDAAGDHAGHGGTHVCRS